MPGRKLPKSRHAGGLSLLELVVVMALTVVLVLIITMLFLRSRDAVRLSTDRLDTSGRSRRTMDALTPFVTSAILSTKPPLQVSDLTLDDLSDTCWLRVTTREAFLDDDYQPGETFVFNALVPANRFQITFRPATRDLVAQQLKPTTSGDEEIDPLVQTKLLGRDVDGCAFRMLSPGSVEVTLRARAERDDERRPGGVTTSTLRALLAAPGVK